MITPWTVELWRDGAMQSTGMVPFLGTKIVVPMAHQSVSWFTTAVYVVKWCSRSDRRAVAEYSHLEKQTLDRPRDPKRFPA